MYQPFKMPLAVTAVTLALGPFAAFAATETATQNIDDARQESRIETTFALNTHLRAHDLKVSVRDGTATLSGTVEDDVRRELAEQIALGVNDITDVDNQIAVEADYVAPEHSDERSFGQVIDDASITASVKSKLLWSKHTQGLSTDVDTLNGLVTLTGTVETAEGKQMATRLAQNTQGVRAVENRLTVEAAESTADAGTEAETEAAAADTTNDITDGWITTKVKSTYLFSSNISGSDISVSTDAGIVTLSGEVDSGAERALAIEFANNIRGVKSVQSKDLNAL